LKLLHDEPLSTFAFKFNLRRYTVDQWASQFKLWTNLTDREIVRFTSQVKEEFPPADQACVCVTTYNMVSAGGKRSEAGAYIRPMLSST